MVAKRIVEKCLAEDTGHSNRPLRVAIGPLPASTGHEARIEGNAIKFYPRQDEPESVLVVERVSEHQ